ncbi:MAG: hypothetical protein JJU46_13505 [Balneolaceae bacterium]|nr:hypothetical protein [Balneolaceae bacterium]MCH8547536.1 hypothetical protein [Balneolaceae bacterium]
MKVKLVPRSKIRVSRKSNSKYAKLKEAIQNLKPGGEALRIKYNDKKELNSIRNIAYTYNKENNTNIRSSSDSNENMIFFYIDK